MLEQLSIAIHETDLGPAQPEVGLVAADLKLLDDHGKIKVSVFIDGEHAYPEKKDQHIVVRARPLSDDSKITIVVTSKELKILSILQYDDRGKPIADDPLADRLAPVNNLGEIAEKIREETNAGGRA